VIRIVEVKIQRQRPGQHDMNGYDQYLAGAVDRQAGEQAAAALAAEAGAELAERAERYYQGEDIAEGPTRMIGNPDLLSELGWMVGDRPTAEQLTNLWRGRRPPDGQALVKGADRKDRTAYWDLVWSVDKSVSSEFGAASELRRRQLLEAMVLAVQDLVRSMSEHLQLASRGRDGLIHENAQLVAAINVHSAARPVEGQGLPDPHLHVHVRLANLGRRADGTYGAISSRARQLYRNVLGLDATAMASLRYHLERLGYETVVRQLEGQRRSWPTIRLGHVPESLIEAQSSRERHIERLANEEWQRRLQAEAKRRGVAVKDLSDAERARLRPTQREREAISRNSRQHKLKGLTLDELSARWREQSARHGHLPVESGPERQLVDLEPALDRIVAHCLGPEGLTRSQSVFVAEDIFREAAQRGVHEGTPYAGIRRAIATVKAQCRSLEPGVYTTHEMWQLEHRLHDRGRRLRSEERLFVPESAIQQAIADVEEEMRGSDGDMQLRGGEQEAALRWLAGRHGMSTLTGWPGVGKTTTTCAFVKALEYSGYLPLVVAISGSAAEQVKAATGALGWNMADFTVRYETGWLRDHDDQPLQLGSRDVIVVDENGLVDSRTQLRFLELCEQAGVAAIRGIGDPQQNQPVLAGGQFRWLSQGGLEMTEIRRQRQEWERRAVVAWRQGRALDAYTAYDQRGQLQVTETLAEAVEQAADRAVGWVFEGRDPRDLIVISDLNMLVDEANVAIRDKLSRGAFFGSGRVVDGRGRDFAVGDRVTFVEAYRYRAERRDRQGQVLRTKQGQPRWRWDRVPTRKLGSVVELDSDARTVTVLTDADSRVSGRRVTIDHAEFGRLNHAWSITNYSSQSGTWELVAKIDTASQIGGRQAAQVGASRARAATWMVIAKETVVRDSEEPDEISRAEVIERHAALASRDLAKTTTLDYDPALSIDPRVKLQHPRPLDPATWRTPATAAQLACLTKLGVDLADGASWVEASLALDRALGHPEGEFARGCLTEHGVGSATIDRVLAEARARTAVTAAGDDLNQVGQAEARWRGHMERRRGTRYADTNQTEMPPHHPEPDRDRDVGHDPP
jgi:conjugative relaxase-like TrwC/TraI family protein